MIDPDYDFEGEMDKRLNAKVAVRPRDPGITHPGKFLRWLIA
jgi:hypothetical protein